MKLSISFETNRNNIQFFLQHARNIKPFMLQGNTQQTHVGRVAESSHLIRDKCSKIQRKEASEHNEFSNKTKNLRNLKIQFC